MLPKTIKILHRDMKLVEATAIHNLREQNVGSFKHLEGELSYMDLGGSETVDTIIHEMLHAIWFYFNIGFDDDKVEEKAVTLLSTGLTTIMRDNPKLFAQLQEKINAKD